MIDNQRNDKHMSADWNTWLLTFVAITSGISAFAQSFNAIHQLWINLHSMRQFWSKRLAPYVRMFTRTAGKKREGLEPEFLAGAAVPIAAATFMSRKRVTSGAELDPN